MNVYNVNGLAAPKKANNNGSISENGMPANDAGVVVQSTSIYLIQNDVSMHQPRLFLYSSIPAHLVRSIMSSRLGPVPIHPTRTPTNSSMNST